MTTPKEHSIMAWTVVAVLFLGSVVNYMDRSVLGVVMPQIRHDLGLSHTGYGLAVNAFLTMYALFYILGGRIADRLGYRRTFVVTVLFWSIANMLHAAARGLASLCLFRALLGVGEGGYYPTAIRAASEWFPPRDRAKAIGVLLCGISVGTLITPPIVAWITYQYGWRAAFLATGASGALLIPLWLGVHRRLRRVYGHAGPEPPPDDRRSPTAAPEEDPTLGQVLRHRKYWCLLSARAMTDSAWYFYLFWMPGYFQEIRGFDLATVGRLLWIPYFFSDVGALGGAWTSSALIRRGWSLHRGRITVLIPSAVLCMLGGLSFFAGSPYVALGLVSIALLGHQSWSSNIHTVITEVTPQRHVAVLYGITGAAGTVLGAASQPVLGNVIDHVGYMPAFVYAGAAYAVAIALLTAAGRIEKIRR
jgi:ACS family hexuronate transporter-like MFS transporter